MAGYETATAHLVAGMLYRKQYPPALPADVRAETPEVDGGSVNQKAWAHAARVLWSQARGTPEQKARSLADAMDFLGYQLAPGGGFQCSGKACEQTPPSHGQQHCNPVASLLTEALRRGLTDLADLCISWFLALFAVSEPFYVAEATEIRRGGAVIMPGARAWSDKGAPGKPLVGGTNFLVDRLLAWRHGADLAPGKDPIREVDELALYLLGDLPPTVQQRLRTGIAPVPPLRWPILLKRRGPDFVAWLPSIESGSGVQRLAGWVDGRPAWGFDDAGEPDLPGSTSVLIRGGESPLSLAPGTPIGPAPTLPAAPPPIAPPAPAPGPTPTDSGAGSAARLQALVGRLRRIAETRPAARREVSAVADELAAEVAAMEVR